MSSPSFDRHCCQRRTFEIEANGCASYTQGFPLCNFQKSKHFFPFLNQVLYIQTVQYLQQIHPLSCKHIKVTIIDVEFKSENEGVLSRISSLRMTTERALQILQVKRKKPSSSLIIFVFVFTWLLFQYIYSLSQYVQELDCDSRKH